MDNPIRSFIAIDPPVILQPLLTQYTEGLRREHTHGFRWVNPQLFHLTLKFLGEISIEKIREVTQALERLAAKTKSFDLVLDRTGAFPTWQSPRTIWIGSPQNKAMDDFYAELESELASVGIPSDKRRFHAHLTLCRVAEYEKKENIRLLENKMKSLTIPEKLSWRVAEINLYRSILSSQGPSYSIISSHKLQPSGKV